jgi:hypothetical protein
VEIRSEAPMRVQKSPQCARNGERISGNIIVQRKRRIWLCGETGYHFRCHKVWLRGSAMLSLGNPGSRRIVMARSTSAVQSRQGVALRALGVNLSYAKRDESSGARNNLGRTSRFARVLDYFVAAAAFTVC